MFGISRSILPDSLRTNPHRKLEDRRGEEIARVVAEMVEQDHPVAAEAHVVFGEPVAPVAAIAAEEPDHRQIADWLGALK